MTNHTAKSKLLYDVVLTLVAAFTLDEIADLIAFKGKTSHEERVKILRPLFVKAQREFNRSKQ